jgi:hypothetical protein
MPAPSDCLASLIGLSQSGNPCFPLPDAPEGGDLLEITASRTGYYLEQLFDFRIASGNGAADLYDRMNKARTLAALNVRGKLRTGALGAGRYIQAGRLGGYQATGMAGTVGPLSLPTHYRDGGALRISSVRLDTTAPDADVVLLLDGEPVAVLPTTGTAWPVSLLVPLDGHPHTLEAQLSPGIRPLFNKLFCPGCSAGSPWGQAVARNLRGITSNTPGQGFTLQVAEVCAAPLPDALCFAAENEELRGYMGQAMVYAAGAELVQSLLVDATVNRYTMLEPKLLPALGAKFQADSEAAIKWLNSAAGLGSLTHPCYECARGVLDSTKVNVA